MSAMLDLVRQREWTVESLAEFLAEPRDDDLDWRRFEIVDGVLVVSPPAGRPHELVVARLIHALTPSIPEGYVVLGSAGIGMGRSYRVTDVTVVTAASVNAPDLALGGPDVLLAVEVESPSSITTDRITKPAQYAQARVPHYWRLETDPLTLVTYRLADGVYAESGRWDAVAELDEPFPARVQVAGLLDT